MQTTKNEIPTAKILIPGGSKEWRVNLPEFSVFLDECYGIGVEDLPEMELLLQNITDMVIDGAEEQLPVSEIKKPLKFLRLLTYMLNHTLSEQKD